jgi:hypothetical protein
VDRAPRSRHRRRPARDASVRVGALAAHYFADAQALGAFDHYVWRDCKEESERFERQFVSIVAVLSQGKVSEYELATQPIETIHRVVCKFISKRPVTYNF